MGILNTIKQKLTVISVALMMVAGAPLGIMGQALAASGTMSLTPGSGTKTQGSIITVSIYENSGAGGVDAAQANLSYPASLLDFLSISNSTAFGSVGNSTGGGGSVNIAVAAKGVVTGSQLVASVRFKVKASSGSAVIAFTAGSTLVSNGADYPTATSGATYTLAPAPPPTPTAPKDTTPPTISNTKVSNITNNTATVSWTTSEPANSGVDYGQTTSYGLAAADTANVTEHKVVLNSALLVPGETFHYVVKSIDPAGNAVTGKDATFKTSGLNMAVTVLDQKSKPVKDATVKFQGHQAKTNSKGVATLSDLKLDRGNLVVSQGGKETSTVVEVIQSAPNTAKPVSIKIKTSASSAGPTILLIILFLLAVLSLWYFLRKAKSVGDDRTVITPPPTLPGNDPDLKSAGPTKADEATEKPKEKVTAVSDSPSKASETEEPMETVVIKPNKPSDDDSDTV